MNFENIKNKVIEKFENSNLMHKIDLFKSRTDILTPKIVRGFTLKFLSQSDRDLNERLSSTKALLEELRLRENPDQNLKRYIEMQESVLKKIKISIGVVLTEINRRNFSA